MLRAFKTIFAPSSAGLVLACSSGALNPQRSQDLAPVDLSGLCLNTLTDWEGDVYEEIGDGLGLAYRRHRSDEVFLLTTSANKADACRRIVSTLSLPPVPDDSWFAVSFDCSEPSGVVVSGDPVVGIFQKSNDRLIPEPTETAWLVDRKSRSFRGIVDVACKSFN